jgi:hypothetical protein
MISEVPKRNGDFSLNAPSGGGVSALESSGTNIGKRCIMRKGKKRLWIAVIAIVSLIVVLAGGFYVYTLDYYRADAYAVGLAASDNVSVLNNGELTVITPKAQSEDPVGFIFYPGGKVEATAYLPLLESLSQKGLTCVLVRMPFNLAVFHINAAEAVYGKFPDIHRWYLAGHSLGGAMASSYAGGHADKIEGLILLGAYPVNNAAIATLAVYGSEDKALDRSKLEGAISRLEIAGGNHAHFGNYGIQKGDGTASITWEDQQAQTVNAIMAFITLSVAGK